MVIDIIFLFKKIITIFSFFVENKKNYIYPIINAMISNAT